MTQRPMTGGQAVVRSLLAHGVRDLFAVPGVQNDWLFNAIYDEGEPFDMYIARHEQGAAYMALGYAASTGRLGVLSVVPGPGLLNASAALATAYSMCAPVLALVGQIPGPLIDQGRGLLHEITNQPATVSSMTRWMGRADEPDEVSQRIAAAIADTKTGDPRPAYLEIPPNVLRAETSAPLADPLDVEHAVPDAEVVAEAAALLASATSPMIIVGAGAIDAAADVVRLAETLQAPVVSHRSGRGVLPSEHPLSVSFPEGRTLWPDVDLLISIGSRGLLPLTEWGANDQLKQLWINADPDAARRVSTPDVSIVARAQEALPALLDALPALPATNRLDITAVCEQHERAMATLEPQRSYLSAIASAVGDSGFLVTDLTQVGYVSRMEFAVQQPRHYLYPGYMGTLGWGFATALGVKVANPEVPVVAICGDGGFLFTANELATAVRYEIATVTVVFEDAKYGNVQLMQRDNYGGRVHATDLTNPDFVAFAESFGAHSERVDGPGALQGRIEANLDRRGPTVLVVQQDDWPNPWPILTNEPVS